LKWYELVAITIMTYTAAMIAANLLLWALFGNDGIKI